MRAFVRILCLSGVAILAMAPLPAQGQQSAPGPQQSIKNQFNDVHRKLLEMAKDFPAEKYTFRLKPEMRSYGEVLVHVASGVVYAGKAGRGEKANWSELNAKDYPAKAAVVALMEKSINEAAASFNAAPAVSFTKTLDPWLAVLEHSAEHYGLLVAYYRANGLVPPESRPRK